MAQETGSATRKVVLLALADHASEKEWVCWHSQATLARETELGERTVRRALADLEALGLISRQRRGSVRGGRTTDLITLRPKPARLAANTPSYRPETTELPATAARESEENQNYLHPQETSSSGAATPDSLTIEQIRRLLPERYRVDRTRVCDRLSGNETGPALREQPDPRPSTTEVPDMVETTIADDLQAALEEHGSWCELGDRCADCRLKRDVRAQGALSTARREMVALEPWLRAHPELCVYCGEPSEHADHLVPLPWTGAATRRFVPTVPACGDCNLRINDALEPTVAGRCAIVADSLRRKYGKKLHIPDRTEAQIREFEGRMRHDIRAAQSRRQVIRRRLMHLDAAGAAHVISA